MRREEYKYFSTQPVAVRSLQLEIESAVAQLEERLEEGQVEDMEAIVSIYCDDWRGKYIMRDFTCMVTGMTTEEYERRYYTDDVNALDIEVNDFDNLLDEVNEELQDYLFDMELYVLGFDFQIGWYDGMIALVAYPVA